MYRIAYHLLFCSKRKSKVLVGPIHDRLEQIIYEVLREQQWQMLELSICPDVVYLYVQGTPYLPPAEIVRLIKWRSAHVLREEFPALKRLPSLWTKFALYSTEEAFERETIQQYIAKQPTT